MKKTLIGLGVLVLMAFAVAACAQGPFADVPTDHWAYEAVNTLQQQGIVIGYPDGTYGGKRAMTRYEFAVAIARLIPIIESKIGGQGGVGPAGPAGPAGSAGPAGPAGTPGVGAEELKSIQALVNEFKDELAALGVDVDALKRDLAALAARVDALEKEVKRVKWTGELNVVGVATNAETGSPIDRDGRTLQGSGPAAGELINSITAIEDFDLNITGVASPSVTVKADINFGNYLTKYLGGQVDDYVGGIRPTTSNTIDAFTPYYMYAEAGLGGGSVQVGRIPVQFTPYTLKMIDVDSYTVNSKTDSGDYPLDGGKITWRFGGVGLTAFAAKTNQNSLLSNGLTAQPTIALFSAAPFSVAGGHAAGGLSSINQAAGAHLVIGTPFKGNLGLTYLQAAGPVATTAGTGLITSYDTATVLGADGKWQFGSISLAAEYAQSTTTGDAGVTDLDDNNAAYDAKLGFGWGKLGIDLGYRHIERNFAAPGSWTKLGMWTNPANVEGPYANLTFGLTPSLSLVANGELYNPVDNFAALPDVMDDTDDQVWRAEGGLKWGLSRSNSVNLGIEYLRWSPDGATDTTEQYINLGIAHQFNPSMGMSLGYQIIDYSAGSVAPYGADYKGGVAVAQFQAKF